MVWAAFETRGQEKSKRKKMHLPEKVGKTTEIYGSL